MTDLTRLLSEERETRFGEESHLLTPPVDTGRTSPSLAHPPCRAAKVEFSPLTLRGAGRRWGSHLPSYSLRTRVSLHGGTGSYSPHRARLALLVFLFLHDIASNTSGSVATQYMNYRFQRMYASDAATTNSSNSSSSSSSNASQAPCGTRESNATTQEEDEAQERLAEFNLYVSYAGTVTMLVAAFFMGALSDVRGRRLLLVLPSFASLADHAYHLLMIWFDLDVRYLYAVAALHGSTGSSCALSLGIFAVTADLTPPCKSRTMAIAILEFVTAMASVVGKLVSGYLLQYFGYFNASLLPGVFYLASFLVCFLCVPETVPQQDRNKHPSVPNPFRFAKNIFAFYLVGKGRQRAQFTLALLLLSIVTVCTAGHGGVITLYLLAEPFCWDPEQLGVYGAVGTATGSFSRLIGLKTLHVFLSDPVILLLAVTSLAGSLVMEGFSTSTSTMYCTVAAGLIAPLFSPIVRSLMSSMAGPQRQGALFTSIGVVETLCGMASSTAYNTLYSATLAYMRGAVFLYMAAGLAFCILIILGLMRISQLGPHEYEEVIRDDDARIQTT